MKLYTGTGDRGETSVIGGRVRKDDARVEAYGTIDELNSFVGAAVAALDPAKFADMREVLQGVQHELFDCGADLATLKTPPSGRPAAVTPQMVERLEALIDKYDAESPPLARFVLPGGTPAAAALHVCRTVCRRAERRVVALAAEQEVRGLAAVYLNRLSDLFFAMARAANAREGAADVEYIRGAKVFRRRTAPDETPPGTG